MSTKEQASPPGVEVTQKYIVVNADLDRSDYLWIGIWGFVALAFIVAFLLPLAIGVSSRMWNWALS